MNSVAQGTEIKGRRFAWGNALLLVSYLFVVLLLSLVGTSSVLASDDDLEIKDARYKQEDDRFKVKGEARDDAEVKLFDAHSGVRFATVNADDEGDWEYRNTHPAAIPCRVLAESAGKDDEKNVEHANDFPGGCGIDDGGNTPPTANANGPYAGTPGVAVKFSSAGTTDPDGNIDTYAWNFGDGGTSSSANPSHTYTAVGTYPVTLTVTDNDGDSGSDSTTAAVSDQGQLPGVSINSTSQNGIPGAPVSEQPLIGLAGYKVFSANDLGMHCGDLDTRISSVLPPFQVVHTQVIRRGSEPDILTPADGVEVVYSASSNPNDPILTGINSAGTGPVLSSLLPDGSVYKTNFWDVARDAYDPFYPQGILPVFYPLSTNILDLGLPMPNVEQLFLGDGNLTAEQQEMNGRFGPYAINDPLAFKLFTLDQPFFLKFPFGYTSEGVNWYEAAGVPLTAFDDYGRENPWALMRVQAKSGGQVLASLDTVLPISGEANCGFCHNDPMDGGNGAATAGLTTVALSIDDTANVPMEVSLEWAADINLLRLHDQEHGTNLVVGTSQDDPPGPLPFKAVVCQSCHYTPALDLAQLGPQGPENDEPLVLNGVEVSPSIANGRDQIKNKSMSNVMHSHHATVEDLNGNPLFPVMPPPVDSNGNLRNPIVGRQVMEATCYQCHPGRRTDCLRGAMASGGMLCQDCHGDMAQVGDDFSRNVSPANPGKFELAGDFYTNPATPRVPWANEPGCGSCHTGDAMDSMHGDPGTIGDPQDDIRLMQAYLTTDTKATPIVPTNRRFAENVVPTGPAAGNPMLYRVSKGHEDVFCEACHGSTHGIWPNKNPNANDNVAAEQLQGHTGTIAECSACHTGDLGSNLGGPHGMHPIGSAGNKFAEGDHEELAKNNPNACRACHGRNGEGTVLSAMAQDRVLKCDERTAFCPDGNSVTFPNDHEVGCTECHDNEL